MMLLVWVSFGKRMLQVGGSDDVLVKELALEVYTTF